MSEPVRNPDQLDISDKAVQEALDTIDFCHDELPAWIVTEAARFRARIEADAKVIEAAKVIAHKRRPHPSDWDDLDAAIAARGRVR